MMKRFYESGGTVLSVDHKQVFRGHVHGYHQQKDIDDAKRARGEPVDDNERYSGNNSIVEVKVNCVVLCVATLHFCTKMCYNILFKIL